jgi:serine/threonine protein kinase
MNESQNTHVDFYTDLKDLLLGMLKKNPSQRLTMEQVNHHPWYVK